MVMHSTKFISLSFFMIHRNALPPSPGYMGSRLLMVWIKAHTASSGNHIAANTGNDPNSGPAIAQTNSSLGSIGSVIIAAPDACRHTFRIGYPKNFKAKMCPISCTAQAKTIAMTQRGGRIRRTRHRKTGSVLSTQILRRGLRIFYDFPAKAAKRIPKRFPFLQFLPKTFQSFLRSFLCQRQENLRVFSFKEQENTDNRRNQNNGSPYSDATVQILFRRIRSISNLITHADPPGEEYAFSIREST